MIAAECLSLSIPLLLGRLVLAACGVESRQADVNRLTLAERWSLAWMLGAAAISMTMVLLGRAGFRVAWQTVIPCLCLVAAAALVVWAFRAARSSPAYSEAGRIRHKSEFEPHARPAHQPAYWSIWLFVILLGARMFWVVTEAKVVPEHFTDAFENWFLKAKVISTLQRVPLDRSDPFYLGGGRTTYPLGMPMLAVWQTLFFGRWDERLVSVAWPAYYVALIGLVGGRAARRAGTGAGLIAAYVLSSLPLIAIHAARSGYADLPLAAHVLATCAAAWEWSQTRRSGWLAIVALNGLFCVLLKREGLLLLAILVLCLAAAEVARVMRSRIAAGGATRRAGLTVPLSSCALMLSAGIALAALSDAHYVVDELGGIGWHGDAAWTAVRRLFTLDTWGLYWWVAAVALPAATWRLMRDGRALVAIQTWALLAFVTFVFLFTANAQFVINGWTFDRSVMQIVPVVVAAMAEGVALERST